MAVLPPGGTPNVTANTPTIYKGGANTELIESLSCPPPYPKATFLPSTTTQNTTKHTTERKGRSQIPAHHRRYDKQAKARSRSDIKSKQNNEVKGEKSKGRRQSEASHSSRHLHNSHEAALSHGHIKGKSKEGSSSNSKGSSHSSAPNMDGNNGSPAPQRNTVGSAASMGFPDLNSSRFTSMPRLPDLNPKVTKVKPIYKFNFKGADAFCALCFYRASKTDISVATHVLTGNCPFVKKNVPPNSGSEKVQCNEPQCDLSFSPHKFTYLFQLKHYQFHNKSIHCAHCNELFPMSRLHQHNISEALSIFKNQKGGIQCSKCKDSFRDPKSFLIHIMINHKVSDPNFASFNRFLPNHIVHSRNHLLFCLCYVKAGLAWPE